MFVQYREVHRDAFDVVPCSSLGSGVVHLRKSVPPAQQYVAARRHCSMCTACCALPLRPAAIQLASRLHEGVDFGSTGRQIRCLLENGLRPSACDPAALRTSVFSRGQCFCSFVGDLRPTPMGRPSGRGAHGVVMARSGYARSSPSGAVSTGSGVCDAQGLPKSNAANLTSALCGASCPSSCGRAWVPTRASVAGAPGGSGWIPALPRQSDWSSRFFAGAG